MGDFLCSTTTLGRKLQSIVFLDPQLPRQLPTATVAASSVVARAKHPPDVRGNAKHGEIVRTDGLPFETLRTLCACQISVEWPGNGHLLEDARPCSEIVQFGNEKPISCAPTP
jgi:hypothetical protein